MIIKNLRARAIEFWKSPAVTDMVAWDPDDPSQGSRPCPRMTAVYDNCSGLLRMVLILDVVTGLAWVTIVLWFAFPPFGYTPQFFMAMVANIVWMSFLSIICWIATVKAVRAERMMIVVGSPVVLAMFDDWPRLKPKGEPEQTPAPVDIMPPEPATATVIDDGDRQVFTFQNEEDELPIDEQEAV